MSKNEMLELAIRYGLFESEWDLEQVSYAMNVEEFADFIVFLFCRDWSRNITILDEETQKDEEVIKLFSLVK